MKLVIYPMCLECPFITYIGAREKEIRVWKKWTTIKAKLIQQNVFFLPYPCPEFMLKGWPRPPMSKDMYAKEGLGKIAENVVEFIVRVIKEMKPSKIILIGIAGSPTCAIFETTRGWGNLKRDLVENYLKAELSSRIKLKKELGKGFVKQRGRGILYEKLIEKLQALGITFSCFEVDKHKQNPFEDSKI